MKAKWLFVVLLFGVLAVAQDKPKYEPTEVQALRLKVKQQDAQIAQRDMVSAQLRFQQSLQALTEEANKVKAENKWAPTVLFSPDTLTFSEPEPEPKK